MSSTVHDVVVIGGGPAGSVVAARLAQLGRSVVVLEKEQFPRFRLGESLLPQSLHILRAIGVLDALYPRFLVKKGAQFHEGAKSTRFSFDGAFDNAIDHAFQVPRDEFDACLLAHAATCGATVRHGYTARSLVTKDPATVGVVAVGPDGAPQTMFARYVVDASGRDAVLAHEARGAAPIGGLENVAFFAHYRGAPRDEGEREGDIHIVLFDGGWHWIIPFKDGRTSVGAVVTRAWLKNHRRGTEGPEALFFRALDASSATKRLLAGAEPLWSPKSAADFSYQVPTLRGPRWLLLGDAGGFIDPLFSTGVHIALWGAYHAAPAVSAALDGDESALGNWEVQLRDGARTFLAAVQGFYAGKLQPYMFTDNPRTYLRRAITSVLSGDVFSDARWARDMRTRLSLLSAGQA